MAKREIDKIIKEIFDPLLLRGDYPDRLFSTPPSLKDLRSVAKLIYEDASEEAFQKHFSKNPNHLIRASPTGGIALLGMLVKPPIEAYYKADYAIVGVGQGGPVIELIEIERPTDELFTKKLLPAQKLHVAINQVQDWNNTLSKNKEAFSKTIIRLLSESPEYKNRNMHGSFRIGTAGDISAAWNAFGSHDSFYVSNVVVIGRWSKLNEREKSKLVYLNEYHRSNNLQIVTYDQLIRKGFNGPGFYE